MGSSQVKIPQVNLTKEYEQTLKGLQNTAPGFFNLNQRYAPQYTDLNLRTLNQTLFGDANAPGELASQRAASTYGRAGEIADVAKLGPEGYAALMRSNPGLAATLGMANYEGLQTFEPGGLMDTLQNTAQQQLALGGDLSPQEQTMIDQATRSGFSERGMFNTDQSLGAELLARDQYSNARLGQRLGWAGNVEERAAADRAQLGNLANLNATIYNPYRDVLGRSPLLGGGNAPLDLMGTLDTSRLFNPAQGNDVFNTNYNAQASAAIGNANNSSALTGSLIGLGGTIIGGLGLAL